MAISGTNVATVGVPLKISTRPVDIGAAGPNGETSGNALVVAIDGTVTIDTTGLATSAKQDTGNTSLSAISGKLPATLGAKAASASLSVQAGGLEYETVAASATDQVLGATGAAGDYLSHIIIQPATTGAGTCTIKDGTTVIFTFTTGTLGDLRPITVPFGLFSVSGAWKVTTGANVAIIGIGDFT